MAGQMDRKDVLRQKLGVLREEHRDLDVAISAIEEAAFPDQLAIKRLMCVLKRRLSPHTEPPTGCGSMASRLWRAV